MEILPSLSVPPDQSGTAVGNAQAFGNPDSSSFFCLKPVISKRITLKFDEELVCQPVWDCSCMAYFTTTRMFVGVYALMAFCLTVGLVLISDVSVPFEMASLLYISSAWGVVSLHVDRRLMKSMFMTFDTWFMVLNSVVWGIAGAVCRDTYGTTGAAAVGNIMSAVYTPLGLSAILVLDGVPNIHSRRMHIAKLVFFTLMVCNVLQALIPEMLGIQALYSDVLWEVHLGYTLSMRSLAFTAGRTLCIYLVKMILNGIRQPNKVMNVKLPVQVQFLSQDTAAGTPKASRYVHKTTTPRRSSMCGPISDLTDASLAVNDPLLNASPARGKPGSHTLDQEETTTPAAGTFNATGTARTH